MWLNEIWVRLRSKQFWSAVSPSIGFGGTLHEFGREFLVLACLPFPASLLNSHKYGVGNNYNNIRKIIIILLILLFQSDAAFVVAAYRVTIDTFFPPWHSLSSSLWPQLPSSSTVDEFNFHFSVRGIKRFFPMGSEQASLLEMERELVKGDR